MICLRFVVCARACVHPQKDFRILCTERIFLSHHSHAQDFPHPFTSFACAGFPHPLHAKDFAHSYFSLFHSPKIVASMIFSVPLALTVSQSRLIPLSLALS
jgi:hypothetical protein